VALERSLTELLQGRSFEGLNDLPRPTFNSNAVTEPNNFVEHFIDSSGVVSWRFFSAKSDFDFVEWDFSGKGEHSNAEEAAKLFGILEDMGKEAVHGCVRPTGRNRLQNSGAGLLGGVSAGRFDMGQHQQSAFVSRRHSQLAQPGRCQPGTVA
jgi:hypothetical protein